MKNAPIGIFDSGLGGLTVAREIARALPSESIIYVGDTARCPYGPQDLHDVQRYSLEICSWLESQGVKLIIIACNTATAASLSIAQELFSIPIIGVVEPGARAAVQATANRLVGVIGTTGTVQSEVYSRAVRTLDAGCTVFSVATPAFVEIVEEGLMLDDGAAERVFADSSEVYIRPSFYEIARDYLNPLKRNGVDTLILGCTHFPMLSTAIGQVMGPRVQLISSAQETAHEVSTTLIRRGHESGDKIPRYEFYTTGDEGDFSLLGSRVFGRALQTVTHMDSSAISATLTDGCKAVLSLIN